jgi:hypothetical protein
LELERPRALSAIRQKHAGRRVPKVGPEMPINVKRLAGRAAAASGQAAGPACAADEAAIDAAGANPAAHHDLAPITASRGTIATARARTITLSMTDRALRGASWTRP